MESLIKEINMLEKEIDSKIKELDDLNNELTKAIKQNEINLMIQYLLGLKNALSFIQ